MNCVELQESLIQTEDGGNAEQQAHLETCAECSALLADLERIASSAATLRAADEPSPRVWNSIAIALRQEGLIHSPRAHHSPIPSFSSRWRWAAWLAPAAAVFVLSVGLYVRQHSAPEPMARNEAAPAVAPAVSHAVSDADVSNADVSDTAAAGLNDADLLQEVSELPPATQAQYADNLRRVNEYIRDAKSSVADDPNDEEARRSLLEAYQQKAMLFDLAMDRSLP
jgi:hypothetical protein